MPKMKTHRASAKRFSKTGSGKLKRSSSGMQHNFVSKPSKRTRHLRKGGMVSASDMKRIKQMITYL